MATRFVKFTADERVRLREVSRTLGIHFEEFVHDAAMQAVDEFEGDRQYLTMRSKYLKEQTK